MKTRTKKSSKNPFPRKHSAHFILKLPYPPTINHYYGTTRTGQRFIGKKGTAFRKQVIECLKEIPETSNTLGKDKRLQIWVEAHVPDRRRRDMDNIKKPLLDALTHAKVWVDDCQVDDCRVVRQPVNRDGGFVRAHIAILDG